MKDLGETGKYNEIQYWDWEQYRDWKLSQNIEEQEKKKKKFYNCLIFKKWGDIYVV